MRREQGPVKIKPVPPSGDTFHSLGEGSGFQDQLCAMLERTHICRRFSPEEIAVLARHAHAYQMAPGHYLFREGGRDSALFIIVEGTVKILKEADYRHYRTIAVVHSGTVLGEMSVVDRRPHSASALAVEPTEIVLITRRNVLSIIEKNPELGNKLLFQLARFISLRLRRTSGLLVEHLDETQHDLGQRLNSP